MTVLCGQSTEVRCWACSIVHERRSRYSRGVSMWDIYEVAVEAIEATRGEFSVAEVWHANGGGPSLHNALRTAIRDMRLHGLVRCMAYSTSRNRCLKWIVVR